MHLLFVDEACPPPASLTKNSPRYFVLAGVAVPELNWHSLTKTLNNIKSRHGIVGELKWRHFSANNQKQDNPLRHLSKTERDGVRASVFSALRTRHHVKTLAVVSSIQDAFDLPYVNNDDDLYFYCLKVLTERFQYRIQDINKEYGISRHGIVIIDSRDPAKDKKIREMHDRLVTQETLFSSTYQNLIEGLFITASHLSPGIQMADLIAGATNHFYSRGYKHWMECALPSFRKSAGGKIEGFGVMFFPNTPWKHNERRRVGDLSPNAR